MTKLQPTATNMFVILFKTNSSISNMVVLELLEVLTEIKLLQSLYLLYFSWDSCTVYEAVQPFCFSLISCLQL